MLECIETRVLSHRSISIYNPLLNGMWIAGVHISHLIFPCPLLIETVMSEYGTLAIECKHDLEC
jgi:hypothetical protein